MFAEDPLCHLNDTQWQIVSLNTLRYFLKMNAQNQLITIPFTLIHTHAYFIDLLSLRESHHSRTRSWINISLLLRDNIHKLPLQSLQISIAEVLINWPEKLPPGSSRDLVLPGKQSIRNKSPLSTLVVRKAAMRGKKPSPTSPTYQTHIESPALPFHRQKEGS